MRNYYICPNCGANLDPEEKCDCDDEYEIYKKIVREMVIIPKKGQIKFKNPSQAKLNNVCLGNKI